MTTESQPHWDLSFLYKGTDDSQIDADVKAVVEKAKNFYVNYRGKLAQTLGRAIADYSAIEMWSNKILVYLFLRQSTNTNDAAVKAKIAETERILSQASGEYLTFFDLELVALDDATLTKLYANDEVVARHKPWIDYKRVFKPHLLSEPVESALTKRAPFGRGAWSEFFDELESDLRFDYEGVSKTLTEMLHYLSESKDATVRAEVMKKINDGFSGPFAKYAAQTLYVVSGLNAVEGKERQYKNPMDGRNKSNRIPDDVVAILHDTVRDIAGPLARRYYKLKAHHLGLEKLRWSDRNAPMPFADTTKISFAEAQETVLSAYRNFSPHLAKIVQQFFDQKRVDAPATTGKRGGAFNCSIVLPDNTPASFTFLNYLGSNRDVMTLAHEVGHGVHGILAGEAQGPLMFDAPIAYCETASVFGEMTTFRFLKERLAQAGETKARLALLMGKIDDAMNTVIRQIGFSNFERRLHGMDKEYKTWQEPKKLSVEELDQIWLETAQELYGPEGEVFTYENANHLWAYVSHFQRPFYVYGYAFGELLTQSLYAQKDRLGNQFEPLYLDMLRSGSTKNVTELLAPFGLNPADRKFWEAGIALSLGAMLKEAEALTVQL